MKILISGGCKNGKSTLAQNLAVKLRESGERYYIATMIPHDAEDNERIARHVKEREGLGFSTIECGMDILKCLSGADRNGVFMLDSATALLANEMFSEDGVDFDSAQRVSSELCLLADNVDSVIFVSDYIYSDAAIFEDFTEHYRRGLALIDRALAEKCDTVIEVCSGCLTIHKGELP